MPHLHTLAEQLHGAPVLAEGVVAAAEPQIGVGLDLPVPDGLGDREDVVGELNSRPRIVDEDEDMADVKARPPEALAVVERERQRLRLAAARPEATAAHRGAA